MREHRKGERFRKPRRKTIESAVRLNGGVMKRHLEVQKGESLIPGGLATFWLLSYTQCSQMCDTAIHRGHNLRHLSCLSNEIL